MGVNKVKSAVLEKNQKVTIKDLPQEKLLPSECEVKIEAAGLCSSDITRGYGGTAYFYPLVMGHEFVGKIIQTGKSVKRFDKNDTVSAFPLIPKCIHSLKKVKCENCKNKNYNLCNNYSYYGSRIDGSFCEILDVYEWNL